MKQILSCQQSKYDRTISLKVVIANVPCYYQIEIQLENSIDWGEGISQIVKCVGVETPHCGNVEMWWIHIVKMWRCGGSTFLVCGLTHPIYTDSEINQLFILEKPRFGKTQIF